MTDAIVKFLRHCEERSDEAIQRLSAQPLDCFASLAMTDAAVVVNSREPSVRSTYRKGRASPDSGRSFWHDCPP
ncbi:hypothetical protein DY468_21280 [Rhodopseudomonas sp. BR0M22]|nr:hypothetical protein [Rhodopseudomonas sp. BR0M22]